MLKRLSAIAKYIYNLHIQFWLLLRVANVRYEAAVNIEAASGKQEHAAK